MPSGDAVVAGVVCGAAGVAAHHRHDLAAGGADRADHPLPRDGARADQSPADAHAYSLLRAANGAPQLSRTTRRVSPV